MTTRNGHADVLARKDCEVLGIGFGPANIALAIAAEEQSLTGRFQFLESSDSIAWQPGMLLSGADVQHNPVRDLVSLRNPRSRFTFINYLHEAGRLIDYLNLPVHFPLRKDFARYIQWAAETVGASVDFRRRAVGITRTNGGQFEVRTCGADTYRANSLVIGTGRPAYIPAVFEGISADSVIHSSQYLQAFPHDGDPAVRGSDSRRVAIIGVSQSGVEVALDLLARYPSLEVTLISRTIGPRLKDTSPFSEEAFFPDFTGYYHSLSRERKAVVDQSLRATNYSAVDADVLHRLYMALYERRFDEDMRISLQRFSEVSQVSVQGDGAVDLLVQEVNTGEASHVRFDVVVLATGYRDLGPSALCVPTPPLLEDFASDLLYDEEGYLVVSEGYQLFWADGSPTRIFLNGLCETTHGLGDSGSFSLLSVRVTSIMRELGLDADAQVSLEAIGVGK